MCPRRPCSPAVRGSEPTSHGLRGTVRGTILSPACVLRCPPRSTQAFPSLGRSPALAEARAPGRGSLCTCLFSHRGLGSREDISHWNGSPIALRASTLSQSQLFKHSCDQNTAHSGSGRKEQTQKSGNKEEDSHRSACQGSREEGIPRRAMTHFRCGQFHEQRSSSQPRVGAVCLPNSLRPETSFPKDAS